MSEFKAGDRVLVDGNLVAEIVGYDELANLVTYTHNVGGGTNRVTAHISQTRLEHFGGGNVELNDGAYHAEPPAAEQAAEEGVDLYENGYPVVDEFTTVGDQLPSEDEEEK